VDLGAGSLPAALLAGGRVPLDRDAVLHWLVGGGGALLLAYAAWAHARVSTAQWRGLVAAGVGFLLSTYASVALRAHGAGGATVSLLGSALVGWGALTLVRERQHGRAHPPAAERRADDGER
jgi:hypothetical protein